MLADVAVDAMSEGRRHLEETFVDLVISDGAECAPNQLKETPQAPSRRF